MDGSQGRLLTRLLTLRPLFLGAALFGAGVIGGAYSGVPSLVWLGTGGVLAALGILLVARGSRKGAAVLLSALLFLGAGRSATALEARPAFENRYDVMVSGVVASDPVLQEDRNRLVCRLTSVSVDGEPLGFDVRLYLRGNLTGLDMVRYGQPVTLEGHLRAPEPATNPNGFDFALYLWKEGMGGYVTGQLDGATLGMTPASLRGAFYEFRLAVARRVDEIFPRSAALVRALILGDRSGMDEDLRADFSQAGVAHLLAISGMHVTLLAMALSLLLKRILPPGVSFVLILLGLCFYGALAGFRPSIVRAILMYAALGFAPIVGRDSDPFTRLGLAFGLMLAVNPLDIFDTGFVLSFGAVGSLLCLSPLFTRALSLPLRAVKSAGAKKFLGYFAALLSASLAAALGTLPGVVASYGSLPLLGPLTNLLAVPLAMAGLALALLALALSWLSFPLGALLARVPDVLLQGLVWVTRLGASLPLSDFPLARYPGLLIVLHGLLLLLVSEVSRLRKGLRAAALAALPVLAALAVALHVLSGAGLSVLFLDAGQADCAVIVAQGNCYMVDTGGFDSPAADYLAREGVSPEAIFLSHPHDDHAGGLADILETCPPKTLYLPEGWYAVEADDGVDENVALAAELGVEIVELSRGDRIQLSPEVEAEVIHPPAGFETENPNSLSMVLQVRYGDGAVLFTGDLPMADEPEGLPISDVLKIAHHGAASSTSVWQIAAVSPSLAVIQVGRHNSYRHPSPETLARLEDAGIAVLRNDLDGAVQVRVFKNGNVMARTWADFR